MRPKFKTKISKQKDIISAIYLLDHIEGFSYSEAQLLDQETMGNCLNADEDTP